MAGPDFAITRAFPFQPVNLGGIELVRKGRKGASETRGQSGPPPGHSHITALGGKYPPTAGGYGQIGVDEALTASAGQCIFFLRMINLRWMYYQMTGNSAVCGALVAFSVLMCAVVGSSVMQGDASFVLPLRTPLFPAVFSKHGVQQALVDGK